MSTGTWRMDCSDVDSVWDDLQSYADTDYVVYASASVGFALSLLLIFFGARLIRPLSATLGGVGGAISIFVLSRNSLPCEGRLVVSAAGGGALALLCLCLFKAGLFLLGATGFAAIAHFVWEGLSLSQLHGPFHVFGRPVWYFCAVGVAAIAGSVTSQCGKETFERAISSLIGGIGVSVSGYAILNHLGQPVPLLAVAGVSVAGCLVGTTCQKKKKQKQ